MNGLIDIIVRQQILLVKFYACLLNRHGKCQSDLSDGSNIEVYNWMLVVNNLSYATTTILLVWLTCQWNQIYNLVKIILYDKKMICIAANVCFMWRPDGMNASQTSWCELLSETSEKKEILNRETVDFTD